MEATFVNLQTVLFAATQQHLVYLPFTAGDRNGGAESARRGSTPNLPGEARTPDLEANILASSWVGRPPVLGLVGRQI